MDQKTIDAMSATMKEIFLSGDETQRSQTSSLIETVIKRMTTDSTLLKNITKVYQKTESDESDDETIKKLEHSIQNTNIQDAFLHIISSLGGADSAFKNIFSSEVESFVTIGKKARELCSEYDGKPQTDENVNSLLDKILGESNLATDILTTGSRIIDGCVKK